jgi:hypothetical protein
LSPQFTSAITALGINCQLFELARDEVLLTSCRGEETNVSATRLASTPAGFQTT